MKKCTQCGKGNPDFPTFVTCPNCREWHSRNRAEIRELAAANPDICPRCGKPKPVGQKQCDRCVASTRRLRDGLDGDEWEDWAPGMQGRLRLRPVDTRLLFEEVL